MIKRHVFFAVICAGIFLIATAWLDIAYFTRQQHSYRVQEQLVLAKLAENKIRQEKMLHDGLAAKKNMDQKIIPVVGKRARDKFFEKLVNAAESRGLLLQSGDTKDIGSANYTAAYLKLTGDLSQVLSFFEFIADADFFILLDSFTLKAGNDFNVQLNINLSIYPFSLSLKQRKIFSAPELNKIFLKLEKNPDREISDISQAATSFSLVSFKQLHFIGSAKVKGCWWAWLKQPNHQLISVQLLDYLGSERARVVQINEQGVVVSFGQQLVTIQ